MTKYFAFVSIALIAISSAAFAQKKDPLSMAPAAPPVPLPYFNLDFETEGTFKPWQLLLAGYEFDLDAANVSHGKQSLKIAFPYPDERYDRTNGGSLAQILPIGVVAVAKWKLEVSVDIKCEGITKGATSFFAAILHDSTHEITHKSLSTDSIRGTQPWKTYTLTFDCDTNVRFLDIACMLGGTGKAWFDHIVIKVSGQALPESPLPIVPSIAKSELATLAAKLVPFDPNGQENDPSLIRLDTFIDAHRIIALGEATIGTHEFVTSKLRLVKYLVQKKGFVNIGFEGNAPEMAKINAYINGASASLDSLLHGMYYWCWMTQEMKDVIEWLRIYNAAGHHIQFFGFDMEVPYKTSDEIASFAAAERLPHSNDEAALAKNFIDLLNRLESGKQGNIDSFAIYSDQLYKTLGGDQSSVRPAAQMQFKKVMIYADNLRQFASIVSARSNGQIVRDSAMAVNVENELLIAGANAKSVIWSENIHIAKGFQNMGYYLQKKFSDAYGCIGFVFDKGSYNAEVDGTPVACTALPSHPGSFENLCKTISTMPFFLNLDGDPKTSGLPRSFYGELEHRSVGLVYVKYSFWDTYIPSIYDAIVYIPEINPDEDVEGEISIFVYDESRSMNKRYFDAQIEFMKG